jgi:hypothetical protein
VFMNPGFALRMNIHVEFSDEGDKFPAIAGIAGRYGKHFTEQLGMYFAGLWSNFIIEGLVWSVMPTRIYAHKPEKFRAPTWSWASVDGAFLRENLKKDQLLAKLWYSLISFPQSQDSPVKTTQSKSNAIDLMKTSKPQKDNISFGRKLRRYITLWDCLRRNSTEKEDGSTKLSKYASRGIGLYIYG